MKGAADQMCEPPPHRLMADPDRIAMPRRAWPAVLVLGAALGAAVVIFAARWLLASASELSIYDDEGFVIAMLRSYLAGHPLYSGFYAQYGPFAYQALAAAHRLLAWAPTNDSLRVTSVVFYAATFAVWSGIAVRLLRTPAVIVLFALALTQHLMAGTVEPGHPQDLAALLVSLCVAAALMSGTAGTPRVRRAAAIGGGAAAAALLLTKLNVGVFVVAALLCRAAFERPRWRHGQWMIPLLPLLLMHGRIGDAWVRTFCTIESAGLLLLVCTLRARGDGAEPSAGDPAAPTMLPWLGGAAVAALLILTVEIARGTTVAALVDGIVLQHLHFPSQAVQPAFMPPEALAAAGLSALVFVLLRWCRHRSWYTPARDACRLVAAATGMGYAIGLGADYLLALVVAFTWLFVLPRGVDRRWVTSVAALALLLPLQAYPIAGTQVYLGAVPLTFLCALTFDDVVTEHRSAVIRVALPLLAAIGLLYEGRALTMLAKRYTHLTPLALSGASLVRLPASEAAEYQRLTARMQHFDAFVSEPGLLSLYAWTEQPPPTPWNAGAWMTLIRPERQAEIIAALRRAAHPGAIVNPLRTAFWTEGVSDVASPLARFLDSCAPAETIGAWEVRDCGARTSARADHPEAGAPVASR